MNIFRMKSVKPDSDSSGESFIESTEDKAKRMGRTPMQDLIVRIGSVAVVGVAVFIAIFSAETFINGVGFLRTFVTKYCSWWIVLCAFLSLIFCVIIALRYGKIRLGGPNAKPAFSYFSWVAMLFSTGQGVGLVFWAVAEPIMMQTQMPFVLQSEGMTSSGALAWTYFHWALPAWAIYAIVSLFMAYSRYNRGKDACFRATIEDLFPGKSKRVVGVIVEIFVVLAVIFGMTTSLGLASYQFSNGVSRLVGVEPTLFYVISALVLFGVISTIAVWLGVVKGIKRVSDANAVISIVFVILIFIFGPTLFLCYVFPESIGIFIDQFVNMSLFTEPSIALFGIDSYAETWQTFWSFFIFCWCFAFATFTAGFVSTISRGRSLREFVMGVVTVPVIVCMIWTLVLGGSGIFYDIQQGGLISAQTLNDSSLGLLLTIESVPIIAPLLVIMALILIAGYIITTINGGVVALGNFVSTSRKHSRSFNALLVICIMALALVFLITAGETFLTTIQFATVAGGIPFTIIVVMMGVQFFKWVKKDPQLPENAEEPIDPNIGPDLLAAFAEVGRYPAEVSEDNVDGN